VDIPITVSICSFPLQEKDFLEPHILGRSARRNPSPYGRPFARELAVARWAGSKTSHALMITGSNQQEPSAQTLWRTLEAKGGFC
jgi:hypothetical protein